MVLQVTIFWSILLHIHNDWNNFFSTISPTAMPPRITPLSLKTWYLSHLSTTACVDTCYSVSWGLHSFLNVNNTPPQSLSLLSIISISSQSRHVPIYCSPPRGEAEHLRQRKGPRKDGPFQVIFQ